MELVGLAVPFVTSPSADKDSCKPRKSLQREEEPLLGTEKALGTIVLLCDNVTVVVLCFLFFSR